MSLVASPELQKEINDKVKLPKNYTMPRSLEFLSEKIQCVIAPQPWCTPEEIRLYPKIVLEAQQACSGSRSNEAEIDKYICSAILPKINGNITPKLPVYNRLFRKRHY